MAQENKARSTSPISIWKQHRVLVITTAILVFFAIALSVLPIFLQRGLANYLSEHGAQNVSIGDVDFNIFSGALIIRQAGYTLVEENPFHCDEMSINVDILPVFSNHIFIQDINLNDCRVVIHRPDPDTLIVNGFKIPLTAEPHDDQGDTTPVAAKEPWFIGLHGLHLSDIAITYRDAKITTEISIDNITVNDIAQWEPDFVTDYSIAVKINNAPISLVGTIQPFHASKSFTGDLKISDFDFKHFIPLFADSDFVVTGGLLNTELNLSSTLNDENKYEVNIEGNLDSRSLKATLNEDQLSQDKLQWNGKAKIVIDKLDFYKSIFADNNLQLANLQFKSAKTPLSINLGSFKHQGQLTIQDQRDKQPNTQLAGSSKINNLAIVNAKTAFNVTLINTIEANQFELSTNSKFLFPSIVVHDAKFAGKTTAATSEKKSQDEYLLTFSNMTLSDTQVIDQRDVMLTGINIQDIKTLMVKDKQGKLKYIDEISQTFAPQEATSTDSAVAENEKEKDKAINKQAASPPTGDTINVNAGVVELQGNNSLVFKDYSVAPFFQINLRNLLLKLAELDTASPENSTRITFSTDIDESGKLQLSGESKLFSPGLTTRLKGKLTNLELHPLTSYTLPTSGRKMRHGLLSSDISINIDKRNLDSKFEMVFKNLSLVKDDDQIAKKFDDTMPLPIEMAIDLMEDKQGHIKLSVPVQGNLDNPEFQLMPAILSAIRKTLQFAALSYMKYALQPWGSMLFVGELLHGQMTKITFEPVEFAPGDTTLTDTQKEYLDKLSNLMQKTPRLDLTVCGVATALDANASAIKTEKASQGDKKDTSAQTINHEALLSLAKERADSVKAYLIKEKQIAPQRLHNCTPTFKDDVNAKPVVDFVF